MKKHILLILLLTSAAIGQDRGLLPVVPNLTRINHSVLIAPGNASLGVGEGYNTGLAPTALTMYTQGQFLFTYNNGVSLLTKNFRIEGEGGTPASTRQSRFNVAGGIRADTGTFTETVKAKTVVADSAAVKILVYDSTKAVRDSLVWIVKSIDLPIGPYANAARMGSVTFRLIVPGTGVRDFGIVGDTANGVMLSYAAATVTGTYAPNAPFQVWQQVGLYWYTEYFPNAPAGHAHLNKVRADLSKWNNAPAIRRYVFDGSGAYYSEWEIVVNYVMATPASASTWYVKIID